MKTNIFICGQDDDVSWYPKDSKFIELIPDTKSYSRFFNPFHMGPVTSFDNFESLTLENFWQRSLVYEEDWDYIYSCPLPSYYRKRQKAFTTTSPVRHKYLTEVDSLGFWHGIDCIPLAQARIQFFIPIYSRLVYSSPYWENFRDFIFTYENVVLYDYDAYNCDFLEMTFKDVVTNEEHPMGCSFLLRELLYSCMF